MIGDISSNEEVKHPQEIIPEFTGTVRDSINIFKKLSKKKENQGTPDFKRNKRETISSEAAGNLDWVKTSRVGQFRTFLLLKIVGERLKCPNQRNKIRNIFPSQPNVKKTSFISSNRALKRERSQPNAFSRISFFRRSQEYASIGVKEGVTHSTPLDVATLTNFSEAMIKA
ncbi:unnamed protein product [Moneuplotes crassus]|uniref:Uncharacterized protein n=1 Tax=Euplotes crassus TaxID=5936 RepID=A0AAD1UE31_EUPCR|nr:unnamed protein product [Moneuplotes crassus]